VADPTEAYSEALFEIARAEGHLARVEDELFRFARIFETSDQLRMTLTDKTLPVERRQKVIEELLGAKASPLTVAMVSFVIAVGRARTLPDIVDHFVARAAEQRREAVAEIRTAYPLDEDHRQRLSTALERATGKRVSVKEVVDPSVLGGVVAIIGDTVIDASIRHRLEQLRESL
jgi:F-type H+-transporting ATPase subunit delta